MKAITAEMHRRKHFEYKPGIAYMIQSGDDFIPTTKENAARLGMVVTKKKRRELKKFKPHGLNMVTAAAREHGIKKEVLIARVTSGMSLKRAIEMGV